MGFCAWQPLGQWDPTTDLEVLIETELMRIAKEKMTVAGVTKLSAFQVHQTALFLWKVNDICYSPA